jgi:hypothetical protein
MASTEEDSAGPCNSVSPLSNVSQTLLLRNLVPGEYLAN